MDKLDVAMSPDTPQEVLEKLADDPDWEVRTAVAYNPNTSLKVLEKLANDPYFNVRWEVTRNPKTIAKVLKKLANDPSWEVRKAVAYNTGTTAKVLEKLSNDPHGWVRSGVAYNPSTSTKVLEKLSNDPHGWVRSGVAYNPNTTAKVLEKLASDCDLSVRIGVLERGDITLPFVEEHFPKDTWNNAECVSALLEKFGEAALPIWLGDADHTVIKTVKDAHGNPLTLFKVALKGDRGTVNIKCLLCYCPSQQTPFFLIPPNQETDDPEVARKSTFPVPLDARQGDVGIYYSNPCNKVTLPLGGILET